MQKRAEVAPSPAACDASALESGFLQFRRSFDSQLGGFGAAPKFPRPVAHNFLLRYLRAHAATRKRCDMVLATLRAMAKGGMNDQLGGGFHRYSVDERWFVPHFEKMLYDQAQLAISYLEAYQITHDAFFAGVARHIFDYVLRDMIDTDGGFYSAEDADSVIDPGQARRKRARARSTSGRRRRSRQIAGRAGGGVVSATATASKPHGNVAEDPHSEFTGKNILFRSAHGGRDGAAFRKAGRGSSPALIAAAEQTAGGARRSACGRTSTTRFSPRGTAS